MTRKTKWWVGGVLAVCAVAAAAAITVQRRNAGGEGDGKKAKPALEFAAADVVRLERRQLAVDVDVTGTVQAISQTTVRAKVAAEVKRVLVREGDKVRTGQTVAEFDTSMLRAQLAERTAALASARAQLDNAKRTRDSNAELVKQNFISKSAFDNAEGTYQAQSAAVSQAEAQLEQTEIALGDAVVRSPIAGTVSKRHVQPGEKVGFDAPLLSIVDLSDLEVAAQASLQDIAKIQPGMPAIVQVEGLPERSFSGKVERINPSAEPGTRSISVYVSLKNEESLLKAGMFARVRLTLNADREVAALPVSAVRGDGANTYVWIVAGGRLERRPVSIGARDPRSSMVEILAGVQPTEVVLATKFDQLEHGRAAKVLGKDLGSQAGGKTQATPAAAGG
jgi:membrane fusion protein, multidrug efflux system